MSYVYCLGDFLPVRWDLLSLGKSKRHILKRFQGSQTSDHLMTNANHDK